MGAKNRTTKTGTRKPIAVDEIGDEPLPSLLQFRLASCVAKTSTASARRARAGILALGPLPSDRRGKWTGVRHAGYTARQGIDDHFGLVVAPHTIVSLSVKSAAVPCRRWTSKHKSANRRSYPRLSAGTATRLRSVSWPQGAPMLAAPRQSDWAGSRHSKSAASARDRVQEPRNAPKTWPRAGLMQSPTRVRRAHALAPMFRLGRSGAGWDDRGGWAAQLGSWCENCTHSPAGVLLRGKIWPEAVKVTLALAFASSPVSVRGGIRLVSYCLHYCRRVISNN
jgi:hypothetical protein